MVLPVMVPNTVINATGFYISYNDYDSGIYGSDTTALVDDAMAKFLILNGDHRQGYQALMGKGYDACVAYFLDNIADINRYSDRLV